MANYVPARPCDAYEAENTFYLRSHPARLAKLLAHYELYRMITSLPGAVVELGVYKGASLVRMATFRNLLENADSRPVIGFDAFGAFPCAGLSADADKAFVARFEANGGEGISRETLAAIFADKGLRNVELVEGNIFDTLPAFLADNPAQKIALLHLDMDVYEPTTFALAQLMPRMVRGGLVIFDDYTMVEGATRSADELCRSYDVHMEKLPHYAIPAYFRAP